VRIVTIARKPCAASSTTANVVEHEAGALNIDATRIGASGGTTRSHQTAYPTKEDGREDRSQHWAPTGHSVVEIAAGRWPANVILQHRPGCEQTGTTTAPGYTINRFTDGAKPFGGGAGHEHESESEKQPDERVATWDCEENCPVRFLGKQSGESHSSGGFTEGSTGAFGHRGVYGTAHGFAKKQMGFGDVGTAARYFKQVKK
jgi:hypothetical protein